MKAPIRAAALCIGAVALLATTAAAELVPAEGAAINRTHILFQWDPILGAVRYHLQVAQAGPDPFNGALVVDTVVTTPWHIETAGFVRGKSYVWRVWTDSPTGEEHHFSIQTLPSIMPSITIETDDPERYQPGITIFSLYGRDVMCGIDENGNWVWVNRWGRGAGSPELLPNGNVLFISKQNAVEGTIGGQLVWESPEAFFVHHDCIQMPNDHIMCVTADFRIIEEPGDGWLWRGDRLVEFDRDGNVVWSWSTFDHIDLYDYDEALFSWMNPNTKPYFDWTHMNTCVYDPVENVVYTSLRNLSRVLKIDYETGDVIWSMGFRMQSGQADFGDNLFSFQHAPELEPNGNILLFDNGDRRDHSFNVPPDAWSRAIEIAFDWDQPEPASIIWEYVCPAYNGAFGDADRLPNGNTLVTAGYTDDLISHIIEASPEGDDVWHLIVDGYKIYRSGRIPSLYIEKYWDKYEMTVAPAAWFQPGWVWFSLPLIPRWSGEASAVLGYQCANRLYGWDDAAKVVRLYPDDFTELTVGPGYAAHVDVGQGHTPAYEGAPVDRPFEWTLPAAGWCWVGVPSTQDIAGSGLSVRKGEVTRTAAEDAAAPDRWLNWNWVYWDPTERTAKIMNPFGSGDDESLHPWWGYFVWSNTEDVTLIYP